MHYDSRTPRAAGFQTLETTFHSKWPSWTSGPCFMSYTAVFLLYSVIVISFFVIWIQKKKSVDIVIHYLTIVKGCYLNQSAGQISTSLLSWKKWKALVQTNTKLETICLFAVGCDILCMGMGSKNAPISKQTKYSKLHAWAYPVFILFPQIVPLNVVFLGVWHSCNPLTCNIKISCSNSEYVMRSFRWSFDSYSSCVCACRFIVISHVRILRLNVYIIHILFEMPRPVNQIVS